MDTADCRQLWVHELMMASAFALALTALISNIGLYFALACLLFSSVVVDGVQRELRLLLMAPRSTVRETTEQPQPTHQEPRRSTQPVIDAPRTLLWD